MKRRALLTGASIAALAATRALAQPVPIGSPVGSRRLGPGPHAAAGGGPPPSLDLNFMTPGLLDPSISFTRASVGTYFDNAGTMQTAASGAARWDYNPSTHALNGLLVEEVRSNILINSQAISTWARTDVTFTNNATTSPDGTVNATLCAEGTAGTAVVQSNIPTVTAASTITFSIFLKRGNTNFLRVLGSDTGSANGFNAWIDLTTGIVSSSVRGTATAISASSVTLPNGWYRLLGTCTMPAGSTTATLIIKSATGNGQTPVVNNAQYYAWGGQIEAPGAFATSYISTAAAGVTRAADSAIVTPVPWFVAQSSTLAAEYIIPYSIASANALSSVELEDGTNANLIQLRHVGGASIAEARVYAANASVGAGSAGSFTANAVMKHAATFGSLAGATSLNGGIAVPFTFTANPTGIIRMDIGFGRISQINGWMRRIRYWPRLLSATELQQVTR